MTGLQVAQGLAAAAVLLLMLYLLARKPRDVRLRAITGLVTCWAIAYPFGIMATRGVDFLGLEPMASRLVQHALLLVGAYSLICFFLFSAFDTRSARTRAWWHALPLSSAVVVLTIADAIMPAALRTAAAVLPAEEHQGPVGVPSIGLFYTTANSYLLFAFVAAWVLTRRHARRAEPRLRRGLLLASVGLTAIVVANVSFVAANIVRWAHGTMPHPVLVTGIVLLLPGVLLFLTGLSYPAAVLRLAALRVWWRHRRIYQYLGPLWTALHGEFPEHELTRVPSSPWRDAVSLRGVHRRYYRRVIECRDGLVRISPHVAQLRQNGRKDDSLVHLLKDALRAHAAGEPAPPDATPVAVPTAAGLNADVDELVALSRVLHTTARKA
ncbi:MAG TPA: MAB_1171c family putative transporter [Pseudonocardiaceae bacterium]|nr:MAB_1171c family putative transporter [Pseudonocardiaceae bacterium]